MGGRGETEHLGHLRESHSGGFQQITDLGDGEPVDPVAGAGVGINSQGRALAPLGAKARP